jgi:hypothetical protein
VLEWLVTFGSCRNRRAVARITSVRGDGKKRRKLAYFPTIHGDRRA